MNNTVAPSLIESDDDEVDEDDEGRFPYGGEIKLSLGENSRTISPAGFMYLEYVVSHLEPNLVKVEEVTIDPSTNSALVTFTSPRDAKSVVDRGSNVAQIRERTLQTGSVEKPLYRQRFYGPCQSD